MMSSTRSKAVESRSCNVTFDAMAFSSHAIQGRCARSDNATNVPSLCLSPETVVILDLSGPDNFTQGRFIEVCCYAWANILPCNRILVPGLHLFLLVK